MKKGRADLRKLLSELETLPEETLEGLVKFLTLLLTMDRTMGAVHLEVGRFPVADLQLVLAWGEGEGLTPDFRELLRLLGDRLQGEPPERSDLIVPVLATAGKAYELGEEAMGRLLLQLAIIMTAGQEGPATAAIRDIASAAALTIVRPH